MKTTHWFYDEVKFVYDEGMMNGTGDMMFSPNASTTRGMIWTILARYAGQPTDGIPWVPEGVAVFKNADNVEAAKYFVEWLFSSDENLRMLAEIDQKDGAKLVKPSLEGVELGYDTSILMEEDLSLFGAQRTEILERFETLMGDKAANE